MRGVGGLPFDKFSEECQLDVVCHDIRGALNIAFLHEQFEVRHRLVLQLLQPLVQLHVILIRAGVVILTSAGFAPVSFRHLEGAVDFVVEGAVPFAGLPI